MPLNVMTIFGTRPDAIKMAPVVLELQKYPKQINTQVVVSGQHREMLDQVLDMFKITASVDLKLMQHGQSLSSLSARALQGLEPVITDLKPDIIIAQGDTTTTFIASLAAYFHQIPFGHVEAGLRTETKYDPFPEEMNRRLTGQITEYHFAPTALAKENLIREHVPADKIWVTGNTGIDAMFLIVKAGIKCDIEVSPGKRMVLVTTHRRENWSEGIENICRAILTLLKKFDDIEIVYSLHKNPTVRETVRKYLDNNLRVQLVEPPDYAPFVDLMKRSYLILSDSGGIQEEAPSLGKPVLVLRKTTERPEGVAAGTSKLIGTSYEAVVTEASELLSNRSAYEQMSHAANPYGDGMAAKRICEALFNSFGINTEASSEKLI